MRAGEILDGRFVLVDRVGAGGMGVVFAAKDLHSGARVAVKIVHGPEAILQRFAREVAVLAAIDHPRVVRYVADGRGAEGSYLAMEWLEGEDLAVRIARGSLDLGEAMIVLRGVSEALAALHRRGVVHRDVKPSNVYLIDGECERVKLLDLGIARAEGDPRLTATGAAIGTPAYMSPEQVRGEGIDPRSDLYSAGCLLFECLTGRPPFAGEQPIAILARMLLETPPSLADAGVDAPAAVEELLVRLLDKRPEVRPADGAALLAALAEVEGRRTCAARPARPPLSARERRVVSLVVIVADLGRGDTVLPDELDGLGDALKELAERHHGDLELLGGGSFIAVFAGSVALESRALQAAAFALEARPLLGDDRIAIATGRAIVGRQVPYGPVIDRALALVERAGLDIGVDESTARLASGRFEIVLVDGLYVLRGQVVRSRPRRTVLGRETRFVGRRREMSALASALDSCAEESLAAVVVVVGDAGSGKSRLLREFTATLRGPTDIATLYNGAASVSGRGGAFGLIASALQQRVRDDGSDTPYDYVYRRLRARRGEIEATRAAELLAALIPGATAQGTVAAQLRDDRVLLGDAIADAWRALVTSECERAPVVLVLEDIHAGDASSVKLVDNALRVLADLPLLVLASARPEVHERFPKLWRGRGLQEIRLADLSDRVANRLVRQILGGDASEARVEAIVARGGGNPLLIEELLRAEDASLELGGDLPDNVFALAQTRYDVASPAARQVLRAASVFGEEFAATGLRELLGPLASVEAPLRELIEREFIVPREVAPGGDYGFVHTLIRDAAYASLTDEDRIACHRIAGAWLETGGATDALKLAEHFDRGEERESAGRWYCAAAQEALAGNDLAGAIHLALRARDRNVGESSRVLSEAHYWRGDLAAALAGGRAAMGEAAPGSDPWYAALSLVISSSGQQGDNDEVKALLALALAHASPPGSDAVLICISRGLSQLHNLPAAQLRNYQEQLDTLASGASPGPLALGWIERVRAETAPHLWMIPSPSLRRAREFFEEAGALRYVSLMEFQQALALSFAGAIEPALALIERASSSAEALGIPLLRVLARLQHAVALFFSERDAMCLERIGAIRAAVRENPRLTASLTLLEGIIAFDAGDYAEAERCARFGVEAPIAAPLKVSAYGLLGRIYVRLGRAEEALALAEKSLRQISPELRDPMRELASIAVIEASLALRDRARAESAAAAAWAWISSAPFSEEQRVQYLRRRTIRELHALILDCHGQAPRPGVPSA